MREKERSRSSRYEPYYSHRSSSGSRLHSSSSSSYGRREETSSHEPVKPVPQEPTNAATSEEQQYVKRQRIFLKTLKRRSALRRKLLTREMGGEMAVCGRREMDENRRFKYRLNPGKHRATSRYDQQVSSKRERDRYKKKDDQEMDVHGDTYKDSNIFMKGTQSANPHNDYSQHFVDTCQRPQNFIRDVGIGERFREYPKLRELIRLKEQQIREGASQPMYLQSDIRSLDFSKLGVKFDVILLEPPLEEYQRRASGVNFTWTPWDWEEILSLKLEDVGAQRSFIFIWCGSCEGLDMGRECLKRWGYRRCEDICWVKTNTKNPGNNQHIDQKSIFQNTKEHCLMGIKGTVRRNQDGHFIHANIDLDIIITEEPTIGDFSKPEEIFHIMEHFCLGRRRLHLFGSDNSIRPGWLTVGPALTSSNFSKELYQSYFSGPSGCLLQHSDQIETLRPKTPPPKGTRGGLGGRGGTVTVRGGRGGRGRGGRGGF